VIDYRAEYADYWSRPDRRGTHSVADPRPIVAQILQSCGIGNILDISSGNGLLVQTLLRQGIDAHGIDVAENIVEKCNARIPSRFTVGSILKLPFDDASFDTLISTDCLEHIAPADIPTALREMHRLTRRGLFLRIATEPDRDSRWHLTVHNRDWWEQQLFNAGFRKHPRYYAVLPYEELEHEPSPITIVMEKIPRQAAAAYPLASLAAERDLHMDMLRETGRRSDAHVVRYNLAAALVRPGDRVLDAATGLGYGAFVIRQNSLAKHVVGIDQSHSAIKYAQANYGDSDHGLEFRVGELPKALDEIPDNSFDLIASFETLEQLTDPNALLAAFHRILRPGGRLIVSVPNKWTDETGKDPNPHHLHVFTWQRILGDLSRRFIVDETWQQIASGCRVAAADGKWLTGVRRLRQFDPASSLPDSEWCLVAAMKSPLSTTAKAPYNETVFANVAAADSPVGRYAQSYENPWLLHSMVHIGYRLHSSSQLAALAKSVLEKSSPISADAGAALCVLAYRAVERTDLSAAEAEDIATRATEYLKADPTNPHILRWQISLTFVVARIWLSIGAIDHAIEWFLRCSAMDSLAFSPHLATKTTEAFYEAGRLNLHQGHDHEAQRIWSLALQFGRRLLATPLEAVLVNPDYPNLFDHGDGMREFTLALDFLTRCANGIHLLQRQQEGHTVDWQSLDRSFSQLAATLQEKLSDAQLSVNKLTAELNTTREQLVSRTAELDTARTDLQLRTAELDRDRAELRKRNSELDATRNDLLDRTAELTAARNDLLIRTAELDRDRADLRARNSEVDVARNDLLTRTDELNTARKDLVDRTAELDAARQDLIQRTAELKHARTDLHTRTEELNTTRKDLVDRTDELNESRKQLVDRTTELNVTRDDLVDRTSELNTSRQDLVDRTTDLDTARKDLVDRTIELDTARKDLIDRTAEVDAARKDLIDRTNQLDAARAKLKSKKPPRKH
jgi:ubiquinone/menaquinone biosynthesis C-methylase UbiE/uncharacterized coiled-coil DUF342 family protein